MNLRIKLFVVAMTVMAVGAAFVGVARADLVVYQPDEIDGLEIVLEGRIRVNPGSRTITLDHKMGDLTLSLSDVEQYKAPTIDEQCNRRFTKAKNDPKKLMSASIWALQHGKLAKFYEGIDKVLKASPKHKEANRIKKLKAEMDSPLPDSDNDRLEAQLRKFCPKKKMKIEISKHFILLHDTPTKPKKGQKFNRAQTRLELLERVYESFLLTFFSRGIDDLEVPKERMMVVLFDQYEDFKTFSVQIDAGLIHAAGYWSPLNNISVFFDHSSSNSKDKESLERFGKKLAEIAKKTKDKEIIRLGKALQVIDKVQQESQDIEVVSHEATHQVAGNTGLFPRTVMTPRWMHEGLAAYFESPANVDWGGIGTVNKRRLRAVNVALQYEEIGNLEFVIGNDIFTLAANDPGLNELAYGAAWGFTHFMLSEHLHEFIAFYRKIGEMPPETALTKYVIVALFQTVIPDLKNLRVEWGSYVSGLKTDVQAILDEDEEDDDSDDDED